MPIVVRTQIEWSIAQILIVMSTLYSVRAVGPPYGEPVVHSVVCLIIFVPTIQKGTMPSSFILYLTKKALELSKG